MSSAASDEIELLERVLLRLGVADTDEKLEATVARFLPPVMLKITSPHDTVRTKVVEVLTHIKRRLTSRPMVKIPIEPLLDQYEQARNSAFLQNFAIIFITMGFPRLTLEIRTSLAAKVIGCEEKLENYQDKLFMLILPILAEMKFPADPAQRESVFKLENKPLIRQKFLKLLQDVLLLPYGVTQDQEVPPGMSVYSFKRIMVNNWRAEELETIKKGIVRLLSAGIFCDKEIFIPLVLASSDTRFSVATPAITELNKICTTIDFSDPHITTPLYTLFSGTNIENAERKVNPCCSRVRQKLLQYLIKCRGKSVIAPKAIQVIFEGLFGTYTNQKCKVLSLQLTEILIKEGPTDIISKVSKVILTGITKIIGPESQENFDVQNAAYAALAQFARTCPNIISTDLKIVVSCFNHLANASPDMHSSIREALISMAPAFAYNTVVNTSNENVVAEQIQLSGQQHLLLAMLADNAESKLNIIQNVTSIFLTACYPEYFAPARFLLLLIAGEKNSLHENVTTYLYGISKKDHINYTMLSSIEYPDKSDFEFDRLSADQKRVFLPSFKSIMKQINDASKKRLAKSSSCFVVGRCKLPFSLDTYDEILYYLRVCLWYSAGVKSTPGDEKYINHLQKFIQNNYEENDENILYQYMQFVLRSVEAKRSETNLLCLYDLLRATPELLAKEQISVLEPLANSLKDVSEIMRIHVGQAYGLLLAYVYEDNEFDAQIGECLKGFAQMSLEQKHGYLLVLGHAFSKKFEKLNKTGMKRESLNWKVFVETVKLLAKSLCDAQSLLVAAAVKSISLIGKMTNIPNVEVELKSICENLDEDVEMNECTSTKSIFFGMISNLIRSTTVRTRIREDAAKCLASLAIGDGEYFTKRNLEKFLSLVKVPKDAVLNIAISEAIASTLCGYDVSTNTTPEGFENPHCNDAIFDEFLSSIVRLVFEPNPHSRQATAVWLLAIVKNCNNRPGLVNNTQKLQFAFTELLSDDSEFVQDVASRGLGLVYALSDSNNQNHLADSLLNQLIGGKRSVNKVTADTELFAEGLLGKTPTGGNITTYKELCSLASDLNQPDMIYQFMQLANHNAAWTSKLGAAFGLKTISADSKAKMEPYLAKIIPRLYRYKYDPTPKIQNSMMKIWDSLVSDPKEIVEKYYWEILRETLANLTCTEWRVRIACCLAVRDLLKRPNGLRLRIDDKHLSGTNTEIETNAASTSKNVNSDQVPEPELKELWQQLFRVMDDIHEGTRLAAQGTCIHLSKLCVIAASAHHGNSGLAVASSILPFLLEIGVAHTVPDIRKISIKTISDMIDSSGSLITPHLPSLIPCLLRATGELDSTKLSYLSTRLGGDNEAQEAVDTLRAEAAKSHHTMETITKCVRFVDYAALEKMTPNILDLMKTTVNLGTKIACAHFVCLVSIRLSREMTPLVGKYLSCSFNGLKDRNATVRKYNASAIGHLIGIAKDQSIKNLFNKLDELYMESSQNRSAALALQSINKRQHDLVKNYSDEVLPLIFFAMHEEPNEENKTNIELWKDLWADISPGDAGIRMNLNIIIQKLEKSLDDISWLRKAQAANSIQTIAKRLGSTIEANDRLRLINLLLIGLQGRKFQGKERLLEALAALCKGLDHQAGICTQIIDAAMRESRREDLEYRTLALASLGDILEELEADRFEEVYNMIWYLLEKKDIGKLSSFDDEDIGKNTELTADERNKRAQIFNKLKEIVCETLGKSWPKNSLETQKKYQLQFAERCSVCLQDSTRSVQVSLLGALTKFVERLQIFENTLIPKVDENKEKKLKVDEGETRDIIIEKIFNHVISAVTYASGVPHTGLKKEALNIVLVLIKRLSDANDQKYLNQLKQHFDDNLEKFQKDSSPEVRCRIKDIEDKFSKCAI